ncbi:hypothetical protein [Armatimonas sp.]|uniref:hypothetical protein n=1 Tax=Armatimonas sp. TaxID=1872638 RepID=UPI00286BD934|nr:hypothetical protein [Armatimonas sp.]
MLDTSLHTILARLNTCGSAEGIRLSSLDNETTKALFQLRTKEALQSLQKSAPSHYRLVRRYLAQIYSYANIVGGKWNPTLQAACIDFSSCAPGLKDSQSQDYPYNLACYSARLVSIATQAHLQSLGFSDNKNTWRRMSAMRQRIQRRCIKSLMNYEDNPKIRQWLRSVDLEQVEEFRSKTYWQKIKLIPQRLSAKK